MKLRFEFRYFLVAILALALGVMVATTFRHILFIRGSVSDIIATMFVFFFILSVVRIRHLYLAIFTLCFACSIEIGQYFHFADRLGLARGSLFSILLGNSFSLSDIFYYTIGVSLSLIITSSFVKERPTWNA